MDTRQAPEVTVLEESRGEPTKVSFPRGTLRRYEDYEIEDRTFHGDVVVLFHPNLLLPGQWEQVKGRPDDVFQRVERRVVPAVVYERWAPPAPVDRSEFRIAIDFDNVIHSQTTPFEASHIIPDAPLPGAIKWLESLAAHGARIFLHTCRFTQWHPHGKGYRAGDLDASKQAVVTWLRHHGLSAAAMERITLWAYVGKPYADVYVDDKAVGFDGTYLSVQDLAWTVLTNRSLRLDALGA